MAAQSAKHSSGKTSSPANAIITVIVVVMLVAMVAIILMKLVPSLPVTTNDEMAISDKSGQVLGVQHVAIIGDDQWETTDPGRSDLMMLARIDFTKGVVTFVSIPRDTAYTYNGSTCKANHAYEMGGGEAACTAISEITGVQVTDYVAVGFEGLEAIVDSFGGVDVMVPVDMKYTFYTKDFPAESYSAGVQTVDGWRACALSRARKGYGSAGLTEDGTRQIVDRYMLVSLMKNLYADPAKAVAVASGLASSIKSTNMSVETMLSYVEGLTKFSEITVYTTTGPVAGGIDADSGMWLAYNDREKWERLMNVVEMGKDPDNIISINSNVVGPSTMDFNESYTISMK